MTPNFRRPSPARVRIESTGRIAAVTLALLVLSASLAAVVVADTSTALSGNPLTVHVGERGQLQAFRAGDPTGIFFAPSSTVGDAGFFLAFTQALPGDGAPKVYGFQGSAGPFGLDAYTPGSQTAATGSGTPEDPLRQITKYAVGSPALVEVTQTTAYVNGAQQFGVRWDVRNVSGATVKFKALAAADFYFDGSDRGTGIFTAGPPRFIGGTNADTGNSGGFSEVLGSPSGSPPWSAYQALAYGSGPEEVWGKIKDAAGTSAASFDSTVVGEPVDNAGGVEWDQRVGAGLPNNQTASFELAVKSAVPQALQLSPSNAGAPRGVPVAFTATAKDTDNVPYAGRTLRYAILGVNPATGSAVLAGDGSATITDPGTNAGADTVVAFVDFNNDGVRQPVEPQGSALATFVDNVAPSCKVKVSGDRPGGGGAGKPLVITITCNEQATVTVTTALQAPSRRARRSAMATQRRKRATKKIKLKPRTTTVRPGEKVPIKLKVPKAVARKYAGKTLTANVNVTVKDSSGNTTIVKKKQKIKLAKLKRKRR